MDNSREAYSMHLSGKDEFDVAEHLRITVDEALALIQSYADSIPSPSNVEARRDEVKRVDTWLQRVDAEYIQHTLSIDKAVNSFCKLSERRCRLLGLDAPSRQEIEATLTAATPSSIDDELNQLAKDLGF